MISAANPGFETIAIAVYTFGNCSVENFRVSLSGIGELDRYIKSGTFLLSVIPLTKAIFSVIFYTVRFGLLANETNIPSSSQ